MTDLIPYDFYNPYPKMGNLAKEMLNSSRRISHSQDRISKAFRCHPGYEEVCVLDELITIKTATQKSIDAGLELLDMVSAEIMRLSL